MIEVDKQINLWVSIQIFSWVSLKPDCIWYCATVHSDLSSKFTPACQPVRCKTKTNHNLVIIFFPASKSMILAGGLQILKIGKKMPEINSDFNRIQTMSFPGSWVFQPVEKLQIETNFWRITGTSLGFASQNSPANCSILTFNLLNLLLTTLLH